MTAQHIFTHTSQPPQGHTANTRQRLAAALHAERMVRHAVQKADPWTVALFNVVMAANEHLGTDEQSTASTN